MISSCISVITYPLRHWFHCQFHSRYHSFQFENQMEGLRCLVPIHSLVETVQKECYRYDRKSTVPFVNLFSASI